MSSAKPATPPLDPALLGAVENALQEFLAGETLPENLRAACLHAVLAGGNEHYLQGMQPAHLQRSVCQILA